MILVTGGTRSGKSAFAERLASSKGTQVLYLATALALDEEMEARIQKHRLRRPAHWETWEGYLGVADCIREHAEKTDCILVDCVTIWITNLLFSLHEGSDYENMDFDVLGPKIMEEILSAATAAQKAQCEVIFVTNELGLGMIPESHFSRIFLDIAGDANQILAKKADSVYAVLSGLPICIKGENGCDCLS